MQLTRKSNAAPTVEKKTLGISRRQFMKHAGITSGGIAAASLLGTGMMRKAEAKDIPHDAPTEIKRTICSACAVGCGLYAEVQNGVWVRQEVAQDHPVSLGGHCCKGADMIDMVRSEVRVKHPMVKRGGKWQRISWDEALDNIANKLESLRKTDGPDSTMFLGSAKFNTEQSYYFRKFAAMFGTNNIDHQARI